MPSPKDFNKLKQLVDLQKSLGGLNSQMVVPEDTVTIPQSEASADIQMQDPAATMEAVQRLGAIEPQEDEPLSQVDHEAVRREVLERIKNRKQNQKLNFTGGILDKHGIYED